MADRDRDAEGRPRFAGPRDRYGRPLPPGAANELGDRVDPEKAALGPSETRSLALRLFETQRYYESHELFEYLWKHPSASRDERAMWKALAQVAVGLCHRQRGNPRGAAALLDRAVENLDRVDPAVPGWERLRRWARAVRAGVRDESEGPPPVAPPID